MEGKSPMQGLLSLLLYLGTDVIGQEQVSLRTGYLPHLLRQ